MRILLIFLILITASCGIFAQNHPIKPEVRSVNVAPAPLFQFTENKKQWEKEVLFRAEIPSGFLFLKKGGLHYGFYDAEQITELRHPKKKVDSAKARIETTNKDSIKGHGVGITFLNANVLPLVHGKGKTGAIRNYFLGAEPSKWASNVQSFEEVNYLSIYKAINLRFFTNNERLKYEFVVEAGGDPTLIKMKYEGADKLSITEDGCLEIETSIHLFSEKKPYTYQIIEGKEVEIPSQFVLKDSIVTFELGSYDAKFPVVIDPQLVFSTFSGSLTDNWGNTATYDSLGNLYTGGTAFGASFPTTVGAFQRNFGGVVDVAISKYNPIGTQQLYSTYIGGLSAEVPHSLVVNSLNQLVILGTTSSTGFPTTFGAYDRTYNGGTNIEVIGGITYNNGSDIFLSTLSENGNQLISSTYIGGSANDGINLFGSAFVYNYGDELRGEVNVDSRNNVYVASTTRSANFPLQSPSKTNLTGVQDAVFFRMNQGLTTLQWSTYWGGNALDVGYSVEINSRTNDFYVCGSTTSPDMRTSPTALRTAYQGGTDGFIARFAADGSFVNASYLGTTSYDQAFFLDIDSENNVYVLGNTEGQYPVSQGVYTNPNSGQFIQKLNPILSTSLWSTVIGARRGRPDLSLTAFLVNDCGNIYVAGWGGDLQQGYPASSTSRGLPVTANAIKTTTDGLDFHIMLLEREARSLLYATFFGGDGGDGDHVDGGTCRFDKRGIIYHAACVCRENRFFTTQGAWSRTNRATTPTTPNTPGTGCNNAGFKIDIESLRAGFTPLDAATGLERRRGCAPLNIRFQNRSANAETINWEIGEGLFSSQASEPTYNFTQPGRYLVRQRVTNRLACAVLTVVDTITVLPPIMPTITTDTIICVGESVQLRASGGTIYRWSPSDGLNSISTANPIAQPLQTTRYTVTIATQDGCSSQASVLVTIANPIARFEINTDDLCDNSPTIRLVNNSPDATQFTWNLGNGRTFVGRTPPSFKYTQSGLYTITLTARIGTCTNRSIQNVAVTVFTDTPPITISRDSTICRGESIQLNASGGNIYRWQPATGLSATNIPNPIANPTQTTRYRVTITNRDNCIRDTAVTVRVANPIANFTVATEELCAPSPLIRLTNTSTDGLNFLWDFGNGETFRGQNPPAFRYQQSGTYRIILTAINAQCTSQASQMVSVMVISAQNPTITRDSTICSNESLQLLATGGISYRWSPATGLSNPNIANPIARPTQTTRYIVTITRREGCVQELSTQVRVIIPAAVGFTVNFDDFCDPFPTVRLVNTSPDAGNFSWNLGNGQVFRGQEPPPFKYSEAGNYRIVLTAQSGNCTNQTSQNLAVERVVFPNVITPNNDGKNEALVFNTPIKGLKIEIFNRWGKLVYQSENYQNDWKGEETPGMYYYLVTAPDGKSCKVWLNVFK